MCPPGVLDLKLPPPRLALAAPTHVSQLLGLQRVRFHFFPVACAYVDGLQVLRRQTAAVPHPPPPTSWVLQDSVGAAGRGGGVGVPKGRQFFLNFSKKHSHGLRLPCCRDREIVTEILPGKLDGDAGEKKRLETDPQTLSSSQEVESTSFSPLFFPLDNAYHCLTAVLS
uniref:Uncharacterized protein n=1 Tax=Sphaerodactylus townsendi TaxID=933632 RepID=A0ACB8FM86_9SAUR